MDVNVLVQLREANGQVYEQVHEQVHVHVHASEDTNAKVQVHACEEQSFFSSSVVFLDWSRMYLSLPSILRMRQPTSLLSRASVDAEACFEVQRLGAIAVQKKQKVQRLLETS